MLRRSKWELSNVHILLTSAASVEMAEVSVECTPRNERLKFAAKVSTPSDGLNVA